MNVIIVGAGIMGLATAWALTRSGHRVTIVEQGEIPNPLAASTDDHRIIRYPYGMQAGYTAMVDEAYAAWDELWDDLGERLYVPTGVLALAAEGGSWVRESAETMAALGKPVRWLTRDDLERGFPLLSVDDVAEAFLVASGGVLLARRIEAALVRHLARKGVVLRPFRKVEDIDPVRGRVRLHDAETLEADAVVVAAGAWLGKLLPGFATRAVPSRQVVAYMDPPRLYAARWTISPVILDVGPQIGFYLVPPVAGTGLKLGDHSFTMTGDPDDDRTASPDEARPTFEAARRRLKDFDRYQVLRLSAWYYTVAPEERFVIERPVTATWVIDACSGHGFKFAPLIARRLAEAIAGERWPEKLTRWAAGELEPVRG